MKVTKLIREYVEQTVSEKYDKQISPEEEVLKALEKKLSDFHSEVNKQVEQLINNAIDMLIVDASIPEDVKKTISNKQPSTISYRTYNTEIDCKARAKRKERDKARDEAIKNILLTLELGGTKADLDRMIAEL